MNKVYFSPARINLIGEHIDYNGGNVLPVAINLGITGITKLRNDSKIILSSKQFIGDGVIEIDLNAKVVKRNNWSDYVSGVLYAFNKKSYSVKQGFEIEIDSTIPTASGLSSSASLEVLFAKIFSDLNDLNISNIDIALLSQIAEVEFVGVNCGIMDQFVIANGVVNNALLLNTSTLDFDLIDFDLSEYKIMILNTKVKRELVDSKYNERRIECDSGLEIAKKFFEINNLCELTIDQLSSIETQVDSTIYKRIYHVVSEQKRVELATLAFNNNNLDQFFECINNSHTSLKDFYEVSCFELDAFVSLAINNGAVAARMIGGGFGGCAIAFVKNSLVEKFKSSVIKQYRNITSIDGEIYEAISSNGVGLIDRK